MSLINKLGTHRFRALMELRDITKNKFSITGSLCLLLNGLLDRAPKDLDIMMSRNAFWRIPIKYHAFSAVDEYGDDKEMAERQTLYINSQKVCVFIVESEWEFDMMGISGVSFFIAKPKYSIAAKELYCLKKIKGHEKHEQDLQLIKTRIKIKTQRL